MLVVTLFLRGKIDFEKIQKGYQSWFAFFLSLEHDFKEIVVQHIDH